ncbi:hypothetical protein QR680_009338 [Steinernema hermaphroditum]|uniref:Tryptophan synthase beta chain-like PALP domain-containing protein n=1 Tax=Steinernema hermaphroditum TaxID=289476 RepID=A0AA39M990_9BILA|nr:hypothetical protein QR680_009338 [Steinernema hermaphroditum]
MLLQTLLLTPLLLVLGCALAPLSKTALLFRKKDSISAWRDEAIQKLWEERRLMGRTPLLASPLLKSFGNAELFFKNESAARTHSLKHRYAWALVLWALVEGHIRENTTVFETSSGNTAVSEAFMCRLIGVKFVAIVPDTIEAVKAAHIEEQGGAVLRVPLGDRLVVARNLTEGRPDRFFMNQFAHADRAEEFHESGDFEHESANVFHEILSQFRALRGPRAVPDFFVHAAGTGGTISSVGRFLKKYALATRVVLADTEHSVYYDYVVHGRFRNESGAPLWVAPGMAGIGFGPMGPAIHGVSTSLTPAVVDLAVKIPDLASVAAMHFLRGIGILGGTSTGVNFVASLHLASKFADAGRRLSVVTLLADHASSYESSYHNGTWVREHFSAHGSFDCWLLVLRRSVELGVDPLRLGACCS